VRFLQRKKWFVWQEKKKKKTLLSILGENHY